MAYWTGHLTLAYHHTAPSLVIVSLGDFAVQPRQFAVQGNGPDPASVSAATGLVAYEMTYAPLGGDGNRLELPDSMRGVQGVLLVQLLDEQRLRVEAFPGKTAAQVTGSTPAALTYTR